MIFSELSFMMMSVHLTIYHYIVSNHLKDFRILVQNFLVFFDLIKLIFMKSSSLKKYKKILNILF